MRFGDHDPTNWTGVRPWQYPVHGIDVSKFQGDIDWRTVRRRGISFAFIKATEGGDHLDNMFHTNWANAGRAGVKRGAYHFYYFCRPAYQQAQWYIRNVPKTRGALPPVLDMEWNHQSRTCRHKPNAQTVRSEMKVFLDIVSRHYGQRPVIYTTPDFYHQNRLNTFRGYEFWLRSVADHPNNIYGRRSWTFWQYTGTGIVPGIAGKTDINTFVGSSDQWRKWLATRTQ